MKRSQSRKLREKIASRYIGGSARDWTEEESFQLVKQEASRDKQKVLDFFEKKYGKVLSAIWELGYKDTACIYVVKKGDISLKIQTPIYRYCLPIGFVHIETAQKWARQIGGDIEKRFDRTDYLSTFLNGEKLEEVDANLNDFREG